MEKKIVIGNVSLEESFKQFEAESLALIEGELEEVLTSQAVSPVLTEASRYSIFPGGKRIRPLFALSLGFDLGVPPQKLVSSAISLELLHCASLVHDDLPALDNDDVRRGRLSCHKKWGEATAVLVGDYLVPLAFIHIARSGLPNCERIVASVAEAYAKVCVGQQLDLTSVHEVIALPLIHEYKTGALFAAAAQIAAFAARVSMQDFEQFTTLGRLIGGAFQLIDDYLDVHGTDTERGRAAGSDIRNEKRTYFTEGSTEQGLQKIITLKLEIDKCLGELQRSGNKFEMSAVVIERLFRRTKEVSL